MAENKLTDKVWGLRNYAAMVRNTIADKVDGRQPVSAPFTHEEFEANVVAAPEEYRQGMRDYADLPPETLGEKEQMARDRAMNPLGIDRRQTAGERTTMEQVRVEIALSGNDYTPEASAARLDQISTQIERNEEQIHELSGGGDHSLSNGEQLGIMQGELDARANLIGLAEERDRLSQTAAVREEAQVEWAAHPGALAAYGSTAKSAEQLQTLRESDAGALAEKADGVPFLEEMAAKYPALNYDEITEAYLEGGAIAINDRHTQIADQTRSLLMEESLKYETAAAIARDPSLANSGTLGQEANAAIERFEAQRTVQPLIDEAQENGDLRVERGAVVAEETHTVAADENTLTTAEALRIEREDIIAEARAAMPSTALEGAAQSYENGRAATFNNMLELLAATTSEELPPSIQRQEITVQPAALEIDKAHSVEQSMSLA
jgi:hypothetical protein